MDEERGGGRARIPGPVEVAPRAWRSSELGRRGWSSEPPQRLRTAAPPASGASSWTRRLRPSAPARGPAAPRALPLVSASLQRVARVLRGARGRRSSPIAAAGRDEAVDVAGQRRRPRRARAAVRGGDPVAHQHPDRSAQPASAQRRRPARARLASSPTRSPTSACSLRSAARSRASKVRGRRGGLLGRRELLRPDLLVVQPHEPEHRRLPRPAPPPAARMPTCGASVQPDRRIGPRQPLAVEPTRHVGGRLAGEDRRQPHPVSSGSGVRGVREHRGSGGLSIATGGLCRAASASTRSCSSAIPAPHATDVERSRDSSGARRVRLTVRSFVA